MMEGEGLPSYLFVVPRIYSSYLKSLTILKSFIIVPSIMETIILTSFFFILLIVMNKDPHIENLALRQQLAIILVAVVSPGSTSHQPIHPR